MYTDRKRKKISNRSLRFVTNIWNRSKRQNSIQSNDNSNSNRGNKNGSSNNSNKGIYSNGSNNNDSSNNLIKEGSNSNSNGNLSLNTHSSEKKLLPTNTNTITTNTNRSKKGGNLLISGRTHNKTEILDPGHLSLASSQKSSANLKLLDGTDQSNNNNNQYDSNNNTNNNINTTPTNDITNTTNINATQSFLQSMYKSNKITPMNINNSSNNNNDNHNSWDVPSNKTILQIVP